MKYFIVLVALCSIAGSFALPVEQDQENHPLVLSRVRRVTCDILSVDTPWGSVNHAACALHCIGLNKGFTGGRCIDGVCNCRR